jgi:hypothetical protein
MCPLQVPKTLQNFDIVDSHLDRQVTLHRSLEYIQVQTLSWFSEEKSVGAQIRVAHMAVPDNSRGAMI